MYIPVYLWGNDTCTPVLKNFYKEVVASVRSHFTISVDIIIMTQTFIYEECVL